VYVFESDAFERWVKLAASEPRKRPRAK